MELSIFIPTRGRTNYTPITAEEVGKFTSGIKPFIVCPPNEVDHYRRIGQVAIGCQLEGIGPTRQWILENCPTRGVVMLDDDLYFSRRKEASDGSVLERCTDLNPLFAWISDQLDAGFVHGGISARQGNNHIGYPFVDCIRVNNAHFFDKEVYLKEGLRFDVTPVMEDFYITLSLLLRGYPNRVIYEFCWSQRASGFKGGCSIYRTLELQGKAADMLHNAFKWYVKVVIKTATSGGALFRGERKDVNISWLKAWEDRQVTHPTTLPLQLKRV